MQCVHCFQKPQVNGIVLPTGRRRSSNLELNTLAAALQGKRPGCKAWRAMQPELAYGRHQGPVPASAAMAGVVLLLTERPEGLSFALLRRASGNGPYAGQMGLPGGMGRPGETAQQAACREAEEELGVSRGDFALLGNLTPLFLFGGNVQVFPFVAFLRGPSAWTPDSREVEKVYDVPVHFLHQKDARGQTTRTLAGISFRAPCWRIQGEEVWGATALILAEFAALLSRGEPCLFSSNADTPDPGKAAEPEAEAWGASELLLNFSTPAC